ncbi:MAG: hypothetical protein V4466_18505 [Pseudomonadota bacterium]
MNRSVLPTVAAIVLLGAGAAIAQERAPPPPLGAPQPQGDVPPPEVEPPPQNWDKPESRTGPRWDQHVAACHARYRTYSPRRDAFMSFASNWVRCRLEPLKP